MGKFADRDLSLRIVTVRVLYSGLMDKLNAAASALARGDGGAELNQLAAFVNQLLAQAGRGIDAQRANQLIQYANDLISRGG